MTLRINLASTIPVYRQIVDGVRIHLVEGTIKPGDLLPPVRQLAMDLGVHFNTVAEAYRILSEEGWLELKRRRGALVVERKAPDAPVKQRRTDFRNRVRELVAELQASGVTPSQIASELYLLAEGLEK